MNAKFKEVLVPIVEFVKPEIQKSFTKHGARFIGMTIVLSLMGVTGYAMVSDIPVNGDVDDDYEIDGVDKLNNMD